MSLPQYISELEKRFEGYLQDSRYKRTVSHPMIPDVMRQLKLPAEEWTPQEREVVDRHEYMKLMGSLMCAALTCRPDLSYSVSLLSPAGQDP